MSKNLPIILAALTATFSLLSLAQAKDRQPAKPRSMAGPVLTLAQNGKTPYVVSLATDAIPSEKTAAAKLQAYLQTVTGTKFALVNETQAGERTPQILVGVGARVKRLLPGQDWAALGQDGIVVKTVGQNLILAGGRPRGALYAVYQFLEDSVGCRWWTAEAKSIPVRPTLQVGAQNLVYRSPFDYREHFTTPPARRTDDDNLELATVLRENGHFYKQTADWGGHYSILGFVHTFSQLLPPSQYFATHPEWYSDPDNKGMPCTAQSKMPDAQNTQLCLSAPGVLPELTAKALAWVKANPEAGYISISENDVGPYCHCPECAAFAVREGSQSGPILNFVNQVAAKIREQYPDYWIETLAYHGSEKPPKTIKPGPGVIVRMAPIDADYGRKIDSEFNANVRDNLKAWAAIAPNLFVWNYVTNFHNTMLPHPNWDGLAEDLRFFEANHVTGIYEQGDSITDAVGDFVYLRAWVTGKLMWDPRRNQDSLVEEFLKGYYGVAAPPLQKYLQLIQESYRKQNRKLSTFNDDFSFLSLDVMNRATQLFDEAARAAQGNEELGQRVRRERLAVDYAWLSRYDILKLTAQGEGKPFLGPVDFRPAAEEFMRQAHLYGVRDYRENRPFSGLETILRATAHRTQPALPDFAKALPVENVFDLQQEVFTRWHPGDLSDLTDDTDASDGRAATIVGDTKEWAVEVRMQPYAAFLAKGQWRAYAAVRVQLNPSAALGGNALSCGIYDYGRKTYVFGREMPLKELVDQKYHWVDYGTVKLDGGMNFYFAPAKNPAVTKVFIDRVILVRQP